MTGPGAVVAFVLVAGELLAGTFIFMWVTMLVWKIVDRGHYRATTWVLIPLMAVLVLVLPSQARPAGVVLTGLAGGFLAAVYSQRPLLEWSSGGAATAASVWMLVSVSSAVCRQPVCTTEVAHVLSGAVFLGAVTHGMILGHWYLNQPRLPIEPLKGATRLIFGAIAASTIAGLLTRDALLTGEVGGTLLPVSSLAYWLVWLGLMAGIAVLTVMVRATVWARSTQSATGLLYLAMIPALGAQFVVHLLLSS